MYWQLSIEQNFVKSVVLRPINQLDLVREDWYIFNYDNYFICLVNDQGIAYQVICKCDLVRKSEFSASFPHSLIVDNVADALSREPEQELSFLERLKLCEEYR